MVNEKAHLIGSDLLEMVTRFCQSVFTLSPAEELIPQILIEAARVFKADIATWFLVTEDRTKLQLVDVYNDRGERTKRPEITPYELNWEATKESDVKGLTAWVAVSGKALFVESLDSLIDKNKHPSHIGKWDKWLYPEGINDPNSGFLCMYAVPLFLPIEALPAKDRIVGVLKMERRKHRKEAFTKEEQRAFDVIASIMGFAYTHSERQRSLTLLDIGHVLIRPLGDIAFSLDMVNMRLKEDQGKEKKQLGAASTKLRSLSKMLTITKDSFVDPTGGISVKLNKILRTQLDALSLSSRRKVSILSSDNFEINLTKRAYAELLSIIIHLVENALQYSDKDSSVEVQWLVQDNNVIIRIENKGEKIPNHIINNAQSVKESANLFRGLPRSYQLAARNGWDLQYLRKQDKNCFEVKILLPSVRKGG